MKYDILNDFKTYMESVDGLSDNTKKKYYQSVKNILSSFDFNSLGELNQEELQAEILKLKTKNDVSAARNGLKHLSKFSDELHLPELASVSLHKRNIKKRDFEPAKLDTIKRKIYAIENKKLRYAYEIMLDTGLRVSEVEQISKESLSTDEDGNLYIFVEHFKGGKSGYVVMENEQLSDKILSYTNNLEATEKLFYSASYMQEVAKNKGFECHDLRRAYAKVNYAEIKSDVGAYAANEEVRKLMGHADIRTTKRYLKRKIIV